MSPNVAWCRSLAALSRVASRRLSPQLISRSSGSPMQSSKGSSRPWVCSSCSRSAGTAAVGESSSRAVPGARPSYRVLLVSEPRLCESALSGGPIAPRTLRKIAMALATAPTLAALDSILPPVRGVAKDRDGARPEVRPTLIPYRRPALSVADTRSCPQN